MATWFLKNIGKLYTLVGMVLACIAIALFMLTIDLPWVQVPILDSLLSRLADRNGDSLHPMDPDEHVYDYSLGADVPRVYILRIPSINLDAPVVKVAEKKIQLENDIVSQLHVPHAFAVGWDEHSAPVGSSGNTVFVGHNNIYGEVFKDLWSLQTGDEIIVKTGSGDRSYLVSRVVTLDEASLPIEKRIDNASWIRPTFHEQLTLVTCFPYSSNTHRLIVIAVPA
jgi:LPXTG-site transpeptidase (sortase) family protein